MTLSDLRQRRPKLFAQSRCVSKSCANLKGNYLNLQGGEYAKAVSLLGAEIHSGIWGPSPLSSLGSKCYCVTFTDDYSRWTRIYLIKIKGEALGAYKAESLNQQLLERVCAMLHRSWLPKSLWGEAIHHTVWLKKRTSTRVTGITTLLSDFMAENPILASVSEWGQTSGFTVTLEMRAQDAHWIC